MNKEISCFKILRSHCPNGLEALVRAALVTIDDAGGTILELTYQAAPASEHCVAIAFTIADANVSSVYGALDHMSEPVAAGTTIRRNA